MKDIHHLETPYGFEYGNAKITRLHSEEKTGAVHIGLETNKYKNNCGLQIYVTKTGKVRIFYGGKEWKAAE